MERFVAELSRVSQLNIAAKLGLRSCAEDDVALMHDLQRLLHAAEVDMTIFFRRLADVQIEAPSLDTLDAAFYSEEKRRDHQPAFRAWLERYTNRVRLDGPDGERRVRMNAANPRYVLRNFLAQQAIDRVEQGELTAVADCWRFCAGPTTTSRAPTPTISGGPTGRKIGPAARCCRVVRDLCRGSGLGVRGSAEPVDSEATSRLDLSQLPQITTSSVRAPNPEPRAPTQVQSKE